MTAVFPGGSGGKESTCNAGDLGSIPGLGRSPGEGKGYHSSILAWRVPWTVQSIGSQRVTHDWATLTSLSSPVWSPVGGAVLQVCQTVPFRLYVKEVKEISEGNKEQTYWPRKKWKFLYLSTNKRGIVATETRQKEESGLNFKRQQQLICSSSTTTRLNARKCWRNSQEKLSLSWNIGKGFVEDFKKGFW